MENNFARNLRNLRRNANLGQVQLAEKLFMAPTLISQYEIGRAYPPPYALKELADFFGISTDELVYGEMNEIPALNHKNYPHFAEKLRKLIKAWGLKYVELDKLTGVHHKSICYYVNQKRFPQRKSLKRLAAFFKISVEELLGEVG